jgi:adenylate cyclase, class 2
MTGRAGANIEVKARYPDLTKARAVCQRIGASFAGVRRQVDTYLHATDGQRLKLRQINNSTAELISYSRPDTAVTRQSAYTITPVADAENWLKDHSDVRCVVRNRRELWLWRNVRIHLDEVEILGSFIEFEGVISSDADEAISRERVDQLVKEFAIAPADQIGTSYSDLILSAGRT